jgi:hypothetical protein
MVTMTKKEAQIKKKNIIRFDLLNSHIRCKKTSNIKMKILDQVKKIF